MNSIGCFLGDETPMEKRKRIIESLLDQVYINNLYIIYVVK